MRRLLMVMVALVAFATAADTASAKTISGELQCRPGDRVAGIWILGTSSGWHGFDYKRGKRPYVGQYTVTNAVVAETLKAWIRCDVLGESYTSFKVGSGSKRHICSSGVRPCIGVGVGVVRYD